MAKPILKRLVEQLRKKGMSEKTAYAIAVKKITGERKSQEKFNRNDAKRR